MENIKELTNFQKVALSLIIKIKNIGKTKLYIGLFIFDGLYYALHKKTFTDCIYLKSKFSPVPHHKFIKELKELSDTIYNVLLIIGTVIAVIIGAILGIQFITGSVEQKAKVKDSLIPFIIGCVIIFGAFGIWKIVVSIGASM